ncbi:hypothetical protein B566_EDAN017929 [Ephemera danica]|nr:hypothetical protein B566_EDAN017929 [Ephemera danica]
MGRENFRLITNVKMEDLATIVVCYVVPIAWNTVPRIPELAYKDANLDGKEKLVIKNVTLVRMELDAGRNAVESVRTMRLVMQLADTVPTDVKKDQLGRNVIYSVILVVFREIIFSRHFMRDECFLISRSQTVAVDTASSADTLTSESHDKRATASSITCQAARFHCGRSRVSDGDFRAVSLSLSVKVTSMLSWSDVNRFRDVVVVTSCSDDTTKSRGVGPGFRCISQDIRIKIQCDHGGRGDLLSVSLQSRVFSPRVAKERLAASIDEKPPLAPPLAPLSPQAPLGPAFAPLGLGVKSSKSDS